MVIDCPKHGMQPCVQMSSDLMRAMLKTANPVPTIAITFHCDGDRWRCHLSPAFAEQHGIGEGDLVEFGDQPWLNDLAGYCKLCFAERMPAKHVSNPD